MPGAQQGLHKQIRIDLMEGKWVGEWKQNKGTDG